MTFYKNERNIVMHFFPRLESNAKNRVYLILLAGIVILAVVAAQLLIFAPQHAHAAALSSPWADGDIGSVGVAGSASVNNGSISVTGSGIVEYVYDKFHYVYQHFYGDGQIVAHISDVKNTGTTVKVGVMIRDNLNGWPAAVNAMMAISPFATSNTVAFQRRLQAGAATTSTSLNGTGATPYWVKLERSGSLVTGSVSQDGHKWTKVGSDTMTIATDAWVGLAVASGSDATTTSATFDQVSVTFPTVHVNVNWNKVQSTTNYLSYGINGYSALDASSASNPTYQKNMAAMNAGIVRLHYAGILNDSQSDSRGWVDTKAQGWDASKIASVLNTFDKANSSNKYHPAELISIPGFPSWMPTYAVTDPNNGNAGVSSGLLNTDQFDNYAAFCASLVKILNVDQHRGIKYFELPNEQDGAYYVNFYNYNNSHTPAVADHLDELITIYNKAAQAMKAVDPSIQVGGPAFARGDLYDQVNRFVKGTISQKNPTTLDFLSMHGYASGDLNDSDYAIYNRIWNADSPTTNSLAKHTTDVRTILDQLSPKHHIPLWFDEYNISWGWWNNDPRMQNNKGAVYDALAMVYFHNRGADMTSAWNDADGVYGKLNPSNNFAFRPSAYVFQLLNMYMRGSEVTTSTDFEGGVVPFAVRASDPDKHSYMLINRTSTARFVKTTFPDWKPAHTTITVYQISAGGFTLSKVSYADLTNGKFSVPDNSVTFLQM